MSDRERSMLEYIAVRLEGDLADAQTIVESEGSSSPDWYSGHAAGLRASLRVVHQAIRFLDNGYSSDE